MDVFMKDGTSFIGCDYPSEPISNPRDVVCFWLNNGLRVVPISDVKHVVFRDEGQS